MGIDLSIPTLGDKFQDYRDPILGDSYNWGPTIIANQVKYFAFHHSVTPQTAKDDGDWKAECDLIAQEHVNGNGWGGVGYRIIICSDGTVAYVGDLSHGGSAVAGNNDIIFSACLVGDFTKELPTAIQIDSAHKLADFFINKMPQYPLIDSWDKVIGHQDAFALLHLQGATPTECPGNNWRTQGDSLRERIIDNNYSSYPDPQPSVLEDVSAGTKSTPVKTEDSAHHADQTGNSTQNSAQGSAVTDQAKNVTSGSAPVETQETRDTTGAIPFKVTSSPSGLKVETVNVKPQNTNVSKNTGDGESVPTHLDLVVKFIASIIKAVFHIG